MSLGAPVLEVRSLSLRTVASPGSPSLPLLSDVSLRIEAGEVVGLSGDSGAGKSLLASAVLGLLPAGVAAAAGSILFRGEALDHLDPARRGRLRGLGMSMVVQDAQSSLDPLRRIGPQLRETLRLVGGHGAASADEFAATWLARVGLPACALRRFPHELSGGQAQRVVLALALCAEPLLLVADEPSSALDPVNATRIAALLRDAAHRGGRAVLLISHDPAVLGVADRVLHLRAVRADPALPPPGAAGQTLSGPAETGAPVLRLDGVRHSYGTGARAVKALEDVSLTLRAGETLVLLGESGSGKSTVARIAAGLLRPRGGAVWRAPDITRRRPAMIFQDARESLDPSWSVGRSVAEPLVLADGAGGRAAIRRRVDSLLWLVGLPTGFGPRLPHGLSGGELQRVAIARALAGEPALLVCDEPTSALDALARAGVLGLLRGLQRELGFAMLFVTHDREAARIVGDRIAVLRDGRLVPS